MVSTFTPNIQWEEPARNDDVGTWDTPVNNNGTLIDLVTGAIATIGLNNANVVLSAAQFRSKQIAFNSTLTGNVIITFPTSFTKSYEIQNLCTGSSAFIIQLGTTAAGGQAIACPPGETIDCFNDGANIKFKNLGRIGEYWDYAGSSVPNWVSGCNVQPYLPCNATTFSSALYPALTTILNSTTTPDLRGRTRYMLDQGVGRVSSSVSGILGNTIFAGGGDQSLQAHNHGITDPLHSHSISVFNPGVAGTNPAGCNGGSLGLNGTTNASATGITVNSAGFGGAQNMPPLLVSGLMLIRAG